MAITASIKIQDHPWQTISCVERQYGIDRRWNVHDDWSFPMILLSRVLRGRRAESWDRVEIQPRVSLSVIPSSEPATPPSPPTTLTISITQTQNTNNTGQGQVIILVFCALTDLQSIWTSLEIKRYIHACNYTNGEINLWQPKVKIKTRRVGGT